MGGGRAGRFAGIADIARDRIREQGKSFAWQERYGAFSVSLSQYATVIKYIDNQEAHHRKISFEDEFISLLKKHKIPFDPKYVFG